MSGQPTFVPGRAAAAVSRSADKLDVVASSASGETFAAAWQPDLAGSAGMPSGWRGWWHLAGASSVAGATVTAVSRSADKLDVFAVGSDNVVYTAAWDAAAPSWTPWRAIVGINAPAGSRVECVSRSTDQLDIFVTDTSGNIQTSAWQPSFGADWSVWRHVAGGVVAPGAPITAVTRSADHLDIFVTDGAGGIQTSAWEPTSGANWTAWRNVAGVQAAPASPVAAVSRSIDQLDVFVTDSAGNIQTSAWQPSFGADWSTWRSVAGGVVAPGTPITAVSRSTDHLDIFVTDAAGGVQTSAWEPAFGADWSAWRSVAAGVTAPGAPITAVSRSTDHLDVFMIGSDGRVNTAAWEPQFGADWRGWWPIG